MICWDRGRPARNERAARKGMMKMVLKHCAPEARFAGGTPAVPAHNLRKPRGHLASLTSTTSSVEWPRDKAMRLPSGAIANVFIDSVVKFVICEGLPPARG